MDARVQGSLDPLLARLDEAIGSGYSALLYGSAVRGDFRPGESDINLLLLLEEAGPTALRRLAEALGRWHADGQRPPFLLSRAEWPRVADAFPLEIADMQLAHEVLRGDDPLSQVRVVPEELRRAVEREGRGVLLRLRQGYVVLAGEEEGLARLALEGLSAVLLLCRGVLLAAARPVPGPPESLVAAAADLTGLAAPAILAVVRGRDERPWRCSASGFADYLTAVATAVHYVDHLQLGSRS